MPFPPLSGRPAVFLDRDDTLIACNALPPAPPPARPGDLIDPDLVQLLPGVAASCLQLKIAGYALVVVSNQGCIARGAATRKTVEAVNDRLRFLLNADAGCEVLDAIYYCPFHPQGSLPEFAREDEGRKPSPGMVIAAAEDLGLSIPDSWLIGDATRDVECGVNAGIPSHRCLMIGAGQVWPDFAAAATEVLRHGTPIAPIPF